MKRMLVLVDEENRQVGTAPVADAHQGQGKLHRAVSALVYRQGKSGTEILLQKRSAGKTLWPLFWTNTICTHPRPGEENVACLVRRLREEMGIPALPSDFRFAFFLKYREAYTEQLSEYEYDGVYTMKWNGNPILNRREVDEYRWSFLDDVLKELEERPDSFTPWFQLMMKRETLVDRLRTGEL